MKSYPYTLGIVPAGDPEPTTSAPESASSPAVSLDAEVAQRVASARGPFGNGAVRAFDLLLPDLPDGSAFLVSRLTTDGGAVQSVREAVSLGRASFRGADVAFVHVPDTAVELLYVPAHDPTQVVAWRDLAPAGDGTDRAVVHVSPSLWQRHAPVIVLGGVVVVVGAIALLTSGPRSNPTPKRRRRRVAA